MKIGILFILLLILQGCGDVSKALKRKRSRSGINQQMMSTGELPYINAQNSYDKSVNESLTLGKKNDILLTSLNKEYKQDRKIFYRAGVLDFASKEGSFENAFKYSNESIYKSLAKIRNKIDKEDTGLDLWDFYFEDGSLPSRLSESSYQLLKEVAPEINKLFNTSYRYALHFNEGFRRVEKKESHDLRNLLYIQKYYRRLSGKFVQDAKSFGADDIIVSFQNLFTDHPEHELVSKIEKIYERIDEDTYFNYQYSKDLQKYEEIMNYKPISLNESGSHKWDGKTKTLTLYFVNGLTDKFFKEFQNAIKYNWSTTHKIKIRAELSPTNSPNALVIKRSNLQIQAVADTKVLLWNPDIEASTMKVMAHEFGHLLGFDDCYIEFLNSMETLNGALIREIGYYSIDDTNIMCNSSKGWVKPGNHIEKIITWLKKKYPATTTLL